MTTEQTSGEGTAKIYTRTGDKGKTSLIGGSRVSKSHLRLDAYGTVDELNSVIGVLLADLAPDLALDLTGGLPADVESVRDLLTQIQNDLFDVGSQLACEDPGFRAQLPGVNSEKITRLERAMDEYSEKLKPLKNFILPGGARSAAMAHIARTVCRRAERHCVALSDQGDDEVSDLLIQYLNRLSDYFFVLARHLNRLLKIDEPIWGAKKPK